MELSLQQIQSITHNVFGFNEKGIMFNRFLDKQYDAFKNESEDFYIRSKASAGVTFDFITDSDYFAMKFKFDKGSSSPYGCFDIYVDKVLVDHKNLIMKSESLGVELPKGEHRLTIYFPWTVDVTVKNVYLSDDSCIKEIKHEKRILAIGDSITQGYIVEYPSLMYSSILGFDLDVEVINQGVSSYYFNPDSLTDDLNKYNFDLVTVFYGTNDFIRCETKDEFISCAKSYLDRLLTIFEKDKIVGIVPLYRGFDYDTVVKNMYKEYNFEDCQNILKDLYKEYDIKCIDEVGIPHLKEFYAPDGIHPNEFGHTVFGKNIVYDIKKIMNW